MNSVQRILSALVVLVAVVSGTTVPAFAAGLTHPVCATKQHGCGATPKVSKCCCGDQQSSQTDSTPVQSRVELQPRLVLAMPAVPSAIHLAITPFAVHTRFSVPPHPSAVDLPTLFSSLLI